MSLEHPGQLPRTKVGKEGHAESCQVLLSTASSHTQAPPWSRKAPRGLSTGPGGDPCRGPAGHFCTSLSPQTLCKGRTRGHTFHKALTEVFVLG